MAKGYQGEKGDVKALPMKKWFNTNYHYIVPEIDDDTIFDLNGSKPFDEYRETADAGIRAKPVLIGPFTFLKLSENKSGKSIRVLADALISGAIRLSPRKAVVCRHRQRKEYLGQPL
ncbi:MAG TPA: hypothetical protein VN370_03210 [Desulfitobacteriaceae bacterium]|nr:hypothetical protein [Desulfitobacteriaceae bacterium]